MKAWDIAIGAVLKLENHFYKIEEREQRGTAQFGKSVHLLMVS
jgi:hypothetical protein